MLTFGCQILGFRHYRFCTRPLSITRSYIVWQVIDQNIKNLGSIVFRISFDLSFHYTMKRRKNHAYMYVLMVGVGVGAGWTATFVESHDFKSRKIRNNYIV